MFIIAWQEYEQHKVIVGWCCDAFSILTSHDGESYCCRAGGRTQAYA
jgi:hypothetical protein